MIPVLMYPVSIAAVVILPMPLVTKFVTIPVVT
jgi:hypothetical protein